ncbi:MAG: hypothetical protein AAFO95_03530 [Cyanobacteria bacterium J06600_6]
MKLTGCSIVLLSIFSAIGINKITSPAVAQCVQADISVQYNISGSTKPTARDNDIDLQSEPGCRGNATITTGVQGNIGGNRRVRQSRKVRHRFTSSEDRSNYSGNTVQIKSNPAIDVYNAADNLDY